MMMDVVGLEEVLGTTTITDSGRKVNPVVLLVLAKDYDYKNANLFVRVGRESFEEKGSVFSTAFRRENRLVRLPSVGSYAVPLRLNTGYRTTYIEVVDASHDISCVYLPRHGEYVNPYNVRETRETLIEVTTSTLADENSVCDDDNDRQADDNDHDRESEVMRFVSSVFQMTEDREVQGQQGQQGQEQDNNGNNDDGCQMIVVENEKKTTRASVDPILASGAEYPSDRIVFVEAIGAEFITGVCWINSVHWSVCNDKLLTAPLASSLYPVSASMDMPWLLRQLHVAYVEALGAEVLYDVAIPEDVSDRVIYPHLPLLNRDSLNQVYESVREETLCALAMAYSDLNLPKSEYLPTDYCNTAVLATSNGLYATGNKDIVGNPLSPWLNEHVRQRWGLRDYVRQRVYLGKTYCAPDSQCPKRKWGRFVVYEGSITSINHPGGHTYGEEESYNTRALQNLRAQLAKMQEITWRCGDWKQETYEEASLSLDYIIRNGFGDSPSFVCYYDTEMGHVYASHPLFPQGQGILLRASSLSKKELELLLSKVGPASDALMRYHVVKKRDVLL